MSDAPLQLPPGVLLPEVEKRIVEAVSASVFAQVASILKQIRDDIQKAKLDGVPEVQPRSRWKTQIGTFLLDYRVFIAGLIFLAACLVVIYLNWDVSRGVLKDLVWLVFSNDALLSIAIVWFGTAASILFARGASLLGVKLKAERSAAVQAGAEKIGTLAVVRSRSAIKEWGWDSPNTHNEIISKALPMFVERFAETLKAAGLDPADPANRERTRDILERVLPDVISRVAASPATPPVDSVGQVVVSSTVPNTVVEMSTPASV
jgi:hypothetical protein